MSSQYWDGVARRYDVTMKVLGGPLPRVVELAAAAVSGEVLEVAAGTGLVTRGLSRAARHVVATDYAPEMVRQLEARVAAEQLPNVTCEQADVYALRFAPGTFDAVVAANVLHLVPDLEGALRALGRVLKPGGKLVVPTYCHDETWRSRAVSRVMSAAGFPGRRRFTLDRLCRAVEAGGFTVRRRELVPGVLPIGSVEATS